MSVLLYIASFAALFALLLSAVACVSWCAFKFFQAFGRFLRDLANPPPPEPKVRIDLNQLKRAGQ